MILLRVLRVHAVEKRTGSMSNNYSKNDGLETTSNSHLVVSRLLGHGLEYGNHRVWRLKLRTTRPTEHSKTNILRSRHRSVILSNALNYHQLGHHWLMIFLLVSIRKGWRHCVVVIQDKQAANPNNHQGFDDDFFSYLPTISISLLFCWS